MKYLDLLKSETYNIIKEIQDLHSKLKEKELEVTREYFKIGEKAIYQDRDGYIEGTIVSVNGFDITIKVSCVNGNRDKNICGNSTFKAEELNLV